MTESNWQGDMLRRMAQQSPAEPTDQPEAAQQPPAQQPPAQQPPAQQPPGPEQPAPPQAAPPQQYQQPYQQQYPQQYPQQTYEQPYPQQPYQQAYQQPYPQQYQQQPPPPPQYPPQQYQAPYQQQYPQQGYYEQPPQHQQPPYEDYPPQGQHNPGQVPYQDYYDQLPPEPTGGTWSTPPTPQSDQLGRPQAPEGDSVFRRFRRIAAEAAYVVGGSGRMRRDVNHLATVRRPIAIMRRVGVLSPITNAGTSTVSALLSTMLSTQRSDRVVVVDADPAGAELSRRLEVSFGAGPVEGVSLVRSESTAEAIRSTLAEVQGQGARDVGLAVVDCPGSMYDPIGSEMAVSAHCTVLVVPSAQQVAQYCLAQLDQLPPQGQDVLLQRGVIVISVVENVDPSSADWLVEAFQQRGMQPVVLPYDEHIVTGWPLRSDQLRSETREAVLELAARVVGTVTGTPS